MAVIVDIEPGLLTVTPDETGGLPVVINGQSVVTEAGVLSVRKQGALVTVSAPTGYTTVYQYKVQLDLTNGDMQEVEMGQVTNHSDWTNDEAGVELAVEEIKEALASGGGGGGGTVTDFSFADANGFAGSVSGSTTTPELTLTTSVGDDQVVVASAGALTGSAGLTHDGATLSVAGVVQINGNALNDTLIVNQDASETFAIGPGGVVRFIGDPGTAGDVLTSAGIGAPPTWESPIEARLNGITQSGIYTFTGTTIAGGKFIIDLTAITPALTSATLLGAAALEAIQSASFLADGSLGSFEVDFVDFLGSGIEDLDVSVTVIGITV